MPTIRIQTAPRIRPQHPCCTDARVRVLLGVLVKDFTALLFLYGQDLAPFRMFRGLSAVHRACLSAPLYKNNPLWGKELMLQMYWRAFRKTKFLFQRRLLGQQFHLGVRAQNIPFCLF
ncbi:hypothetical protein ABIB60_001932 [Hymenobacter sp. UYP22]